jgi:hypothetical protein
MRAITPPRLMPAHPERIVGAKDDRQERKRLLKLFSSSPEEVDDDQRENRLMPTTPVVPRSGTHVVAATAE